LRELFKFLLISTLIVPRLGFAEQREFMGHVLEAHRFISTSWSELNYRVDTYFSDETYELKDNKSEISASFTLLKREGSREEHFVDLRLKVDLPKISRRMTATIERERDRIVEARSNQATRERASQETQYTANIDYTPISSIWGQVSARVGMRFDLPLNPFLRVTLSKDFSFKWVDIHLGQYLQYYRQENFSEYTQLSFSRRLSRKFALAQDNTLSWTASEKEFVLRNSLTLHHLISDRTFFSYGVGATALLSPSWHYVVYDVSLGARRKLYKEWLFGSLYFGGEFEKHKNWDMTSFALVKGEVVF
jgi:hypothetical protein